MNKLIVVRAGTTAWQEQDRIQGTVPLPLCEAGIENLNAVTEILQKEPLELLYCSGNESSGTTAEYLTRQCRFKIKKITAFKEMDFGLWQGLRIKDIRTRYATAYRQWSKEPTSICPPQGETLQQVYDRIQPALQKLIDRQNDKTVVLVAARIAAAVIDCILTETPLEKLWDSANESYTMRTYTLDPQTRQYLRETIVGQHVESNAQKVTV